MKRPAESDATNSFWPPTQWSGSGFLSRRLSQDASGLNQVILQYQTPLRIYLLSTFAGLEGEAEELLQDFMQDKVLKEGWLGKADRSRGRFRDFLKRSLNNFVKDRLRRRAHAPASLDELELDLPAAPPAAEEFDLNWARTILADVLQRMEADCRAPGKDQPRRTHIWEVFRLRLLEPALQDAEPIGYDELVQRFAIVSPFDAQNMLATAKRIFTRHLNTVIGKYEQDEAAVQMEIEALKGFLSRLGRKKVARSAQD
jgi:DNA-directed RNA polymerase specialized sigma24 family protein